MLRQAHTVIFALGGVLYAIDPQRIHHALLALLPTPPAELPGHEQGMRDVAAFGDLHAALQPTAGAA